MKLKRIELPSSGYNSPWLSYWTVAFIFVFLYVFAICRVGLGYSEYDTQSYYAAGDSVFKGVIDDIRPPVYPFILHILKTILGYEGSLNAVTIIQTIVFAISVIYVNKSIRLITPQSPRLCFWLTIFYVLLQIYAINKNEWIWTFWSLIVISDSFAIYCSAFLVYCIIRASRPDATVSYVIWTFVWLLLLVFLRPVMVCYIPVVVFFWIAQYFKYRRKVIKKCLIGIGGVIVVVALLGGYYYEVNKKYHIHSISFVSVINNYAMLRYGGIITPNDADDSMFKGFLEEQIAIKAGDLTVSEQGGEIDKLFRYPSQFHSVVERAVNHAIMSNPSKVIRTLFRRYKEVNNNYVSLVNILLLITGGVIVAFYRKYRQILPVQWTMFLFVISLWILMFIGAYKDWHRLSAPIIPMLLLLVSWAFTVLNISIQNSNTETCYHETK